VATGHLLAYDKGEVGARYVLGGENLTLGEILDRIARICGRRPPRLRLPHGLVLPVAYGAEAWARLARRGEPFVTVEGLRMARKRMFFTSARAERQLGYRSRPAEAALVDAIDWFRAAGYLD
jgi:dihydroflavonol-4-reductase